MVRDASDDDDFFGSITIAFGWLPLASGVSCQLNDKGSSGCCVNTTP